MEVRDWKKTKLSLERPYKDDRGERIPVLLDITPDGEQVFESYDVVPRPSSMFADRRLDQRTQRSYWGRTSEESSSKEVSISLNVKTAYLRG